MDHPDSSFNRFYCAPSGIDNENCRHVPSRKRTGPTGRKTFMLITDSCSRCGRIMRTEQDIDWQSYFWIRKWNKRVDSNLGALN